MITPLAVRTTRLVSVKERAEVIELSAQIVRSPLRRFASETVLIQLPLTAKAVRVELPITPRNEIT